MWLDLVTWMVDACCLARSCHYSQRRDGWVTGGAVDGLPAFDEIVIRVQ